MNWEGDNLKAGVMSRCDEPSNQVQVTTFLIRNEESNFWDLLWPQITSRITHWLHEQTFLPNSSFIALLSRMWIMLLSLCVLLSLQGRAGKQSNNILQSSFGASCLFHIVPYLRTKLWYRNSLRGGHLIGYPRASQTPKTWHLIINSHNAYIVNLRFAIEARRGTIAEIKKVAILLSF